MGNVYMKLDLDLANTNGLIVLMTLGVFKSVVFYICVYKSTEYIITCFHRVLQTSIKHFMENYFSLDVRYM